MTRSRIMTYITIRKPGFTPNRFNRTIFRPFSTYTKSTESKWMPTTDISESDYGYEVRAELPGVSKDDVSISVKDNLLTITGEKHQDSEETRNYHRKETRFGSFERVFYLPPKVEPDNINAEFRDGVLTLSIPKPEEVKPREIQIGSDSSGE
ncbi:heat-shock protein [Candidatus Poribacteria bacterium]|nr:MAG: heat-shock protein [Candidatus Poribacteria bacterium]